MAENDVIAAAAAAFEKRDRIAAEMRAVDAEIEGLLREYTQAKRTWGFTPLMLRRAVIERLQ